MGDLISRAAAIGAIRDMCEECDSSYCGECRVSFPGRKDCEKVLEGLPSAQPVVRTQMSSANLISRQEAIEAVEILLEQTEEDADVKTWNNAIRGAINSIKHHVPSAQQVRTQMSSADDLISRQAAIEAMSESLKRVFQEHRQIAEKCLNALPSAQPNLYGYNMEHLALIAEVLRKENLPPERVVEALTDIGRIASIIRAEFEEELKKSVERCMI